MDFSGKEVAMFYQLCTRQPSWFLHSSDILGEGQLHVHVCYRVKFPANTQWYLEVAIWKTLPQSCFVCNLWGGAVSKDITLLLGLIRTKSCISFQSPHWWSNTLEHKFLCTCTHVMWHVHRSNLAQHLYFTPRHIYVCISMVAMVSSALYYIVHRLIVMGMYMQLFVFLWTVLDRYSYISVLAYNVQHYMYTMNFVCVCVCVCMYHGNISNWVKPKSVRKKWY